MKRFISKNMEDYINIFRDFEIKKRDLTPSKTEKITFRIPSALSDSFLETTGETLKEAVSQTTYAGKVTLAGRDQIVPLYFRNKKDTPKNN